MDLGSRLANLSLAEIASMLDSKQQEILLASISVAARYIQQMQAEEQLMADEQQQMLQEEQQKQILQQHLNNQQRNHLTMQDDVGDEDDLDDELDDDNLELQDELDEDDDVDSQQQQQHAHLNLTNNSKLNLSNRHINNNNNSNNHHHHHHDNNNSSIISEAAPSQIKDFAEELKHRRKLIRLSQKGAAQSLRAFTNGQQPCTDAIIYHFENLQLEPDRAIQLIPLLRDWLEWAEKHRLNGQQLPMLRAVTKVPRERKRKVVLFNEKAKQYLEDAFLKNNHPDRYQLDVISQELNIPTRSIRKWFTNRRQRKRFAEKFSSVS